MVPESIKDLTSTDSNNIVRAFEMLNLVLMNNRSSNITPKRAAEELESYSLGKRLGRRGGFTVFHPHGNSSAVAMTHVTRVGSHYLELDALSRHPDVYGQHIGMAALMYTITHSKERGIRAIGLWTPAKNVEFYEHNGFHVDTEVSEEVSSDKTFFRMERRIR